MSAPRRINVHYDSRDRFTIDIDQHVVMVDQPVADGGDDTAPTPTELFVASLISCMGFFAQRFLRRNGIDPAGLELDATTVMAERPSRVGAIDVTVRLPNLDEALVAPLRRVIEHCTVHNTLSAPPELRIALDTSSTQRGDAA